MKIRPINEKIAVVESSEIIIKDVSSALDLMAQVRYECGCNEIIVNKKNISEEFFNLKTKIAGEILQKFVNYHVKIAIVGDFEAYTSKSLKDFIYECNKGNQIFFLKGELEAIDKFNNLK